jgi:hypothetical protein
MTKEESKIEVELYFNHLTGRVRIHWPEKIQVDLSKHNTFSSHSGQWRLIGGFRVRQAPWPQQARLDGRKLVLPCFEQSATLDEFDRSERYMDALAGVLKILGIPHTLVKS